MKALAYTTESGELFCPDCKPAGESTPVFPGNGEITPGSSCDGDCQAVYTWADGWTDTVQTWRSCQACNGQFPGMEAGDSCPNCVGVLGPATFAEFVWQLVEVAQVLAEVASTNPGLCPEHISELAQDKVGKSREEIVRGITIDISWSYLWHLREIASISGSTRDKSIL